VQRILQLLKNFWKDISVAHKLYAVVGVMALLIALELFTLLFAMDTLSAVRAFVGGEGLWSKAQKGAVLEIKAYARTRDPSRYLAYKEHLRIPLGDHKARIEMNKPDMDMAVVRQGFLEGQVHPQDIEPMVNLIRRFHQVPHLKRAIDDWNAADVLIEQLMDIGEKMHVLISTSPGNYTNQKEIDLLLTQIFVLNEQLTVIENKFSFILGEGSRWLERLLMILLIAAVATVEITGLTLTILISRRLSKDLDELNQFALSIGAGDLSKSIPVNSKDELGQLALALNKMAESLKESTSDRLVAERANEIKSLFLANMSHEIRTPLNAILGFVQLLKESTNVAENRRYLEIIERTGYSLATIINDILDISKVEAGKLEIEKEPCSLKQLLRDTYALLNLRCEEKGITLQFRDGNLPDAVRIDATRFKQILLNVIGNAIKFTKKGGVTATFEVRGPLLICEVEDTGIGIPPGSFAKLFRPFSQLDTSFRKGFGGTGLGLILSKRIAGLMGGDLVLDWSELGKGSRFIISIELELAAQETLKVRKSFARPKQHQPLGGMKILVVEDSVDNQVLAEQFLIREGATTRVASNGLEAIEAFANGNYDVILMDMQMPVMDGYAATSKLRQMGCKIPIIALTANAMRDELGKCMTVGCNDYLSKPFQRENLVALIVQHCCQQQAV
jgi:two-component system, sensor histidine kinase